MARDRSVSHHLAFQAQLRPHALAVLGPAGPVTYRALAHDVEALATEFLAHGFDPAGLVGLHLGYTYLHLLAILALERLNIPSSSLGAADLATAPDVPPTFGLQALISTAAAPVAPPCRWITVGDPHRPTLDAPDTARLAGIQRRADDVVRVSWSSGTTGGMKGAPLTRAVQDQRLTARRWLHGLSPRTRYFTGMPFSQPFGYTVPLAVLSAGGLVILPGPAGDFVAFANALGVTLTGATPTILRALLERGESPTRRLETIESFEVVGSQLPGPLADALRALSPNFTIGYGTTESHRIATGNAALAIADPGAVGHVLPWVEVEIVDAEDRAVSAGREGVLRVRSPQTVAGYWRDPIATQRNFRGGWFYPGDLGALDANRLLRITGRTADVIVRDGAMLSPVPLEAEIRAIPGVRDVAVFPLAGADGAALVAAALELDPSGDEAAMRAAVTARLGERAPEAVFLIDALPRNDAGKVVRAELVNWALRHGPGRSS
ncbi:MAG: acyl--CoA ligase [Alphaproteobacteria bacterium]|nr:acyl--CoA ligase [Alphaproteobacteria bacterium]